MIKRINKGFTLLELLVVVAAISILLTISVSGFISYKKNSDLSNGLNEIVSVLRNAQNKTLSSDDYSKYGVYFDTSSLPNRYILFKGSTYDSRDISSDIVYSLSSNLELYDVNLEGENEIVFERLTGASDNAGSISVRNKQDASQGKTIYIANSGVVSFSEPTALSDVDRVKDSRHIKFNYSRAIDTASESMVLKFDNHITQIIIVDSYSIGGELHWSEDVDVSGDTQTVEIDAYGLGGPNAIFSVFRDRRYNNKSLEITISGDSSGYLSRYSDDGMTTSYSSIYVSDFEWQ